MPMDRNLYPPNWEEIAWNTKKAANNADVPVGSRAKTYSRLSNVSKASLTPISIG